NDDQEPFIDETYSNVRIDGLSLDPVMVRVLMAQSALPHLTGRVVAAACPSCASSKFCIGESAFTPSLKQRCDSCGHEFSPQGRLRKTIANPLLATLARLGGTAPRPPQLHDMALLPEAP